MSNQRWWLAGALFLAFLAPLIYFHDVFFSDHVFASFDLFDYNFSLRHFFWQQLKEGSFSPLYPLNSLGHSLFMNPHQMIWYPTNLLFLIFDFMSAAHLDYLFHFVIASGGWYFYFYRFSRSKPIASTTAVMMTFNGITLASHYRVEMSSYAWFPWAAWSFLKMCDEKSFRPAIMFGLFWALVFLGGNPELFGLLAVFSLFSLALLPDSNGLKVFNNKEFYRHTIIAVGTTLLIILPIAFRAFQDVPLTVRAYGFDADNLFRFSDRPLAALEMPGVWLARRFSPADYYPTDLFSDAHQPWYMNHTIGFFAVLFLAVGYLKLLRKWQFHALVILALLFWCLSMGAVNPLAKWIWLHVGAFQKIRFPGKFFRFALLLNAIPLVIGASFVLHWLNQRFGNQRAQWILVAAVCLNVFQVYCDQPVPCTQTLASKLNAPMLAALNANTAIQKIRILNCLYPRFPYDTRTLGFPMARTGEASEIPAVRAIDCRFLDSKPYMDLVGVTHFIQDSKEGHRLFDLKNAGGPSEGLLISKWYFSDFQKTRQLTVFDPRSLNASKEDVTNLMSGNYPVETKNYFDATGTRNPVPVAVQSELKKVFASSSCAENAHVPLEVSSSATSIHAAGESDCPRLLSIPWSAIPGWRAMVNGQESPIFRVADTTIAVVIPKGKWQAEFLYDPPWLGMMLFISLATGLIASFIALSWASKLVPLIVDRGA